MNDMPGFAAAQRAWENMAPPEDGPSECPDCNGDGHAPVPGDPEGDHAKCSVCKGFGLIDDNGQPFNLNAKEEAEYERGDYLRQREKDEALTGGNGDD